MKAYQKPSMKVAIFNKEAVVTTSGIVIGNLIDADYIGSTHWKSEWDQLSPIGE